MALPKIDKPLFDMFVPSQKRTVKYRPFVVKEEKILLIAQQSGSEKDIVLAIKQVLQNCAQDPTFDVDSLATFDLEYMFLKLRARSVNNIIQVSYRDLEDDKVYDFEVDLDTVDIMMHDEISNKIKVSDDVGIVMKYPSINILDDAPENVSAAEVVEYLVRSCIESIYDAENVYPIKDHTEEEVNEFIDNLDIGSFDAIRTFFDTMPQMKHVITYKNSQGNERTIELTTLSDFFIWG